MTELNEFMDDLRSKRDAGVDFLDHGKYKSWRQAIDTTWLDLSNTDTCVLGQVAKFFNVEADDDDSYLYATPRRDFDSFIKKEAPYETWEQNEVWAAEHGFTILWEEISGEQRPEIWDALTQVWKEIL